MLYRMSLLTASVVMAFAATLAADDARISPPSDELRSDFRLAPYYKKAIVEGGFPIVASEHVSDFALREAEFLIDRMLEGRDDIRQALVKNRVRFAIMATTEMTCDIPEHSDLDPPAYWNKRARGLGSTPARPAVSCGEENLLALDGDPYRTENILVHEFGHAIHEMGMNTVDPTFDSRLDAVYHAALDDGLWRGTYAATNRMEYWAEGVQSWFDTNRVNDREHNDIGTREKLKDYDPRLAGLLAEVFVGNEWRYIKPTERKSLLHLSGFDRKQAAKFAWPAEVTRQFEEHEKSSQGKLQ